MSLWLALKKSFESTSVTFRTSVQGEESTSLHGDYTDDLSPEEKDAICSVLRHFDGQRYELHGFVVMGDHVHVLVWSEENERLENILHSGKSYSAYVLQHRFGQPGRIWQGESFDRIVRNAKELYEKMIYILNNPRRRWPDDQNYRWVWCKGMEWL